MNDKAPPHSHSKASAHSVDAHDSISVEAFRPLRPMPAMIFASRWLQVPLYLGLIVAQAVYVVLFIQELMHLVPILWDPNALAATASTLGVEKVSKEIVVMLVVLSWLIPVTDPALRMAALLTCAMPMMGIYTILAQRFGHGAISAASLLVTTVVSFFTLSSLLWVLRYWPI